MKGQCHGVQMWNTACYGLIRASGKTDRSRLCCRVGLALLKTSEDTLIALPFERLLTALNSRQFPVFSRPPAQLLNLALKFRVSRRLSISLGEYQKQLAKQQQLEEEKEQEQLLKRQQQKAAEAAGQQDGHAGQMGSGNTAAEERSGTGRGSAEEKDPSSVKPSAAQPMENGHAGLASRQPPGGSRSGELPDGPQQRGASSTQQLGSASRDHQVSPFQEAQTSEPSQPPILGNSGSEGKQGALEALHEAQPRSTQASPAHGQQGSAAGKGLGQRQEGLGEDDSFTSACSSPASAAQAADGGDAERYDPAASHEGAAGYPPSKQPSLLPRALSTGNPKQSSGANSAPAGRRRSRDHVSKDQGKQGGSLLNFFRSTSREPESGLDSTSSEHLNGAAK